ncbi:MAG: endonuclease/exonuclease/phosphatase family protein [Gammaproteobacteria bacterium]|nr:endonuclease/exonuclease/phosphatase family protein [Gammaproteobacteria bacterium]
MKQLRITLAYFCLLILGVSQAHADEREYTKLKVLTQNLYLGADIQRVVAAQTAEEIPLLVAQAFSIIDGSDYKSRAKTFALQVKDNKPDVIGLQEVSLIRYQAQSDYFVGNPQMAELVRHDYLADVMDALSEQGLSYKVAGMVTNVDQELPAFGTIDGSNIPSLFDVRLTDRDVILVKENVTVSEVTPYNFIYNLIYPSIVGDIEYIRGAIAVTARVRGEDYRLVNTHLEIRGNDQVAAIQALQMQEIQALLAAENRAIIVMGDLNSDPAHTPDVVYGFPTPYQQMALAGYVDVWDKGGRGTGLTCCRSELLNDFDLSLTERIDYIYTRSASGNESFATAGKAKAETLSDITDGGFWYSDHEGLYAKIKMPTVGDEDDEDVAEAKHQHRVTHRHRRHNDDAIRD